MPDDGRDDQSIREQRSLESTAADRQATPLNVAFYAVGRGGWRDWWTLLHPPYTAWHLSYVVIGASLAPSVDLNRLLATLLGFFLAVGLGAHALDELHGRPLQTQIPSSILVLVAVSGVLGALVLGVVGVVTTGWELIPFIVIGPFFVVVYNAELFGGMLHTRLGFAVAWGAFPVLSAYVTQTHRASFAPLFAAIAAVALSFAQQSLSTPSRMIRRRVASLEGSMTYVNGEIHAMRRETLLDPLESALHALCWAVACLGAAFAIAKLT